MAVYPPFASLANYERYLIGMRKICGYAAVSTNWVEQRLQLPGLGSDLCRLIEEDLATIEPKYKREQVGVQLPAEALSEGWHWGRAYVIEGSAMGATFLLKQAEDDLPTEIGRSFLQQSAAHAKNRWPVFVEAIASTTADVVDAVAGARDVFDYAYNVFASEAN
ncbi:heme oxygenase [Rhodopirellula rubra]|uniref:Heme oxygenase n=1 Tax=Aporhodopirellula rubra TaxID=980271 RepID=A0A7W5E726_9BACT|nr:biliverdin-producing heme oxygenase [Aporhodopirellula rubra]MBB3210482.1 heme oxygenase [Aporhodopirellula rubra]